MKSNFNYKVFLDIKEKLSKNVDVIISYDKDCNITIFFQEQMCDITTYSRDLLPQLRKRPKDSPKDVLTGICRYIDLKTRDIYQILFNGLMVIFDHKDNNFYLIDISKIIRRSTGDSNLEPQNITGSRDGFTENYKDNVSLIRSRIKNDNLMIDEFNIGKRSKTWVGLLSITDIHKEDRRIELIEKLNKVDIDALLTVNDLVPFLTKRTIFPVCNFIGLPDLAASRLLDGEFLLVIDRIPSVIALPTNIFDLLEERIDYMTNKPMKIIQRIMVLFCFFLSTSFLGLLLSFVSYQKDILSLPILATLAVTQKGAIFPIYLEVIFVLFLFELFYFVGFRSSEKTLSNSIILIAGLIIGQNLIDSGLVGVLIITITALSFLASFVVSNNIHTLFGISILRMLFILSSFFFGIFGVTLLSIYLVVYFSKQSFLGEHLLYPFIPFDIGGIKDFFTARSIRKKRNLSLDVKDDTRRGIL